MPIKRHNYQWRVLKVMSSNTVDSLEQEKERVLETLEKYEDEITKSEESIRIVFNNKIGNGEYAEFDLADIFDDLFMCLPSELESDEKGNIAETIINLPITLDRGLNEEIESISADLSNLFRNLKWKYKSELEHQMQMYYQGTNYWSNVKTVSRFRESQPGFTHEFNLRGEEIVKLDSSLPGSLMLSKHLIGQIIEAQQELGEDTLRQVEKEQVESIIERSNELLEEIEDLEEEGNSEIVKENEEVESVDETQSDEK
jgi:hypothetical protein